MSKKKIEKIEETRDSCVLEIAEELKKDNWTVNANLEGWSKPSKVGPTVPDIQATKKGCLTRICQIATPEMFEGNKQNYRDLKNYCNEYDFQFYIIKDGKRVKIDPQTFGKK
jgi:hypothetical protein